LPFHFLTRHGDTGSLSSSWSRSRNVRLRGIPTNLERREFESRWANFPTIPLWFSYSAFLLRVNSFFSCS